MVVVPVFPVAHAFVFGMASVFTGCHAVVLMALVLVMLVSTLSSVVPVFMTSTGGTGVLFRPFIELARAGSGAEVKRLSPELPGLGSLCGREFHPTYRVFDFHSCLPFSSAAVAGVVVIVRVVIVAVAS